MRGWAQPHWRFDDQGVVTGYITWPQQTAEKLTRRSRSRRLPGPELGSSIGGLRSVSSGSAGYEARTAVNDGSKLVIFLLRAAHSDDLSLSFVAGSKCSTEWLIIGQ